MTAGEKQENAIIDAALRLAARRSWRDVRLADIAAEVTPAVVRIQTERSLGEAHRNIPDRLRDMFNNLPEDHPEPLFPELAGGLAGDHEREPAGCVRAGDDHRHVRRPPRPEERGEVLERRAAEQVAGEDARPGRLRVDAERAAVRRVRRDPMDIAGTRMRLRHQAPAQ